MINEFLAYLKFSVLIDLRKKQDFENLGTSYVFALGVINELAIVIIDEIKFYVNRDR